MCEHAVSANHIATGLVAYQQVLAVVVKQVNVVVGQGREKCGTQFNRKNLASQALRCPDVVLMPGPADGDFPHGRPLNNGPIDSMTALTK